MRGDGEGSANGVLLLCVVCSSSTRERRFSLTNQDALMDFSTSPSLQSHSYLLTMITISFTFVLKRGGSTHRVLLIRRGNMTESDFKNLCS